METTPITLPQQSRTTPPPNLAKKFVKLLESIGPVVKSGRNEHFEYNYAREAEVMQAVREAMVAHQVAMVPRVTAVMDREVRTPKQNGPDRVSFITTIFMEFEFVDAESGEACVVTWAGRGEDSSDKGIYKAMTGGEKYALLKVLMIPTHDDPEADTRNDRRAAARASGGSVPARECPRCKRPMRFDAKTQEFYCWKQKGGCGARMDAGAVADSAAQAQAGEPTATQKAGMGDPKPASDAQKNYIRQQIGQKIAGAKTDADREKVLIEQYGVAGGFAALTYFDANRITSELAKLPAAGKTAADLPGSKLPPRDTASVREAYAQNVAARASKLMETTGEVTIELEEGVSMLIGNEELAALKMVGKVALSDLTVEQLTLVAKVLDAKIKGAA